MTELATLMASDVAIPARAKIIALQGELANLPTIEPVCPVKHHFAPGQYAREIFVPANPDPERPEAHSIVIGKIHIHAHVNVVSQGRCKVFTEDGLVDIRAPATFISTPGTKRVVLVLEDLIWTTVHNNPTDTRDLAELERQLIAPDYAALDGGAA